MSNSQYIFSLILFGSLLLALFVFAITSFVFIHRQKTARQQLEMKDALLKARIEVQEQALESVSLEIHDNIGQSLSAARMLLTTGISKAGLPVNKAALLEAARLLAESIDGLRTLAYTLNAGVVGEYGLMSAIEKEVEYVSKIYNLKCSFTYPSQKDLGFNNKENLLLFRMIQESLQNIVKHAKATEIIIRIEKSADIFKMSIRDNGVGIRSLDSGSKGLGLIGMHERANVLEATLTVRALPTRGSEILLTKEMYSYGEKN